jgi:hypothetical protein
MSALGGAGPNLDNPAGRDWSQGAPSPRRVRSSDRRPVDPGEEGEGGRSGLLRGVPPGIDHLGTECRCQSRPKSEGAVEGAAPMIWGGRLQLRGSPDAECRHSCRKLRNAYTGPMSEVARLASHPLRLVNGRSLGLGERAVIGADEQNGLVTPI